MIVTPEHLIKQYFPEPIETTRDLYRRLALNELGYSYSAWLRDLENHCLSKYLGDTEYKLLPDSEKNYWISPKAFRTILEASPSKIGDQIRACVADISRRMAADPAFARQLADQIDQESGIEIVKPKVPKALKAKYNKTGQDAFEFTVHDDTRLYMDIISGYNFQPGQKIKDVIFAFKLEAQSGIPYHIVEIMISLTNDQNLSYRTVWCCNKEGLRYAAILSNKVIRINLFEDNKKLVDSYDYIVNPTLLTNLELDLEKAISMLIDLKLDEIDFDQLGAKILNRYNQNEQAYILAIKAVIPALTKDLVKESADVVEAAFLDAVNLYWDNYVLKSTLTDELEPQLDQMVKERIPGVTLATVAAEILKYSDLCNNYFGRSYSNRQKDVLLKDANFKLIYALTEAAEFNPTAVSDQRIQQVCAFITDQLDLMKNILVEMGQWPSK